MRRGKMHVLHLSRRLRKPFLIHDVEVVLLRGNRRRRNQSSVVGIAGDADQIVLVRLIEKVHLLIKRVRRQILVLNNAVVHGVGNTPHVAQIPLQIDCRLVQQLLRALRRHIFHFIDKTVVQGNPQNTHTDDRYNRKRQCNRHLNGLRLDVFFQEGSDLLPPLFYSFSHPLCTLCALCILRSFHPACLILGRRHAELLFEYIAEIVRIGISDFLRNHVSLLVLCQKQLHRLLHPLICQIVD